MWLVTSGRNEFFYTSDPHPGQRTFGLWGGCISRRAKRNAVESEWVILMLYLDYDNLFVHFHFCNEYVFYLYQTFEEVILQTITEDKAGMLVNKNSQARIDRIWYHLIYKRIWNLDLNKLFVQHHLLKNLLSSCWLNHESCSLIQQINFAVSCSLVNSCSWAFLLVFLLCLR